MSPFTHGEMNLHYQVLNLRYSATHASSASLPGLKSLLERKLEERENFNANLLRALIFSYECKNKFLFSSIPEPDVNHFSIFEEISYALLKVACTLSFFRVQ